MTDVMPAAGQGAAPQPGDNGLASSEALSRQAETLRAVLDATDEAMLVFSPDGRLVDVNRRANELFGVDATVYLGDTYRGLAPLIERIFTDPVAVMTRWADMLSSVGGRFVDSVEQQWPERRLLLLTSAPLLDARERSWGRLVTLRDVTAQRQVDRLRYEFMEALSASLRGPLTTVKGYVDLLLEEGFDPLSAVQREILGAVKQNADGMVATIEELIDVSLLSAAQGQVQKTYVDLRALVESILRTQLSSARTVLTVDLPADLPRVYADPDALTQIVHTAFKGALRHAPEHGTMRVQAAHGEGQAAHGEGRVLLTVHGLLPGDGNLLPSDQSNGPNQDLAQLELAMARSILRQQDGDIVLSDAPDGTVMLTLRLPAGPA